MSYETITAQNQTVFIEDGETFSNKLIDVSNGQGIDLYPRHNTDWTIRNIGVTGYYEGDGFVISVSDAGGGNSVIENVYMADGCSIHGDSFTHGPGGIFIGPEHNGHLDIRNVNVQGFTNNGIYGSAPGGSGTITIENCFGKNNGVTTFRVSSGDVIRDCVAYNDDTEYGDEYRFGWGESSGRPVWAWEPATATVEDSDFKAGTGGGNDYPWGFVNGVDGNMTTNISNVNLEGPEDSIGVSGPVRQVGSSSFNGSFGSSADLSIPTGVPTNAEDAANGDVSPPDPEPDPEEHGFSLGVNGPEGDTYQPASNIEWDAEVENTSETESDIDLDLTAGDFTDSTTLTIADGATDSHEFSASGTDVGIGSHTWEIVGDDGGEDATRTGSLTVEDPGTPGEAEPIGYVTVDFGTTVENVPVYDRSDVQYPAWCVETEFGVGAFSIVERSDAVYEGLSIQTEDGVYAPTALDPVEEEPDPPDENPPDDPTPPDVDEHWPDDPDAIDHFDYPESAFEEYYQGATGNYTTSDGWSIEGGRSLLHNSGQAAGGIIYSTDGLRNYPQEGDEIHYHFLSTAGSGATQTLRHRFLFGVEDDENFYAVTINLTEQWAFMLEATPGSGWQRYTPIESTNFIPANTPIRAELGWDPGLEFGRHSLRFYNASNGDAVSPFILGDPNVRSATDGGIGFIHEVHPSGVNMYTDDVYIESGPTIE